MTATVGLVVNPAAGRDIRRLTGGASVSDDYEKRRTAECVLAGLSLEPDVEVLVMPDRGNLGQRIVDQSPAELDVGLLDMSVAGDGGDTRRAAAAFATAADAVVVLGGDGTNRDVAHTIEDVPVVSVSTGTNNVFPNAIDGTVAGGAAALVATGGVSRAETTYRHGMVEAVADTANGERTIRGLATLGVLDQQFVGTRAILDASRVVGGVVSRASPTEIGLSGIAGGLSLHPPEESGGVGFRLGPPDDCEQTVRAITVPGVVERLGVRAWDRLDDDETTTFELPQGVVSVDGERELEVREATIDVRPVPDGPVVVDVDAVYERAARDGFFSRP
ncbi:ATP-NAD kinase [Halogeometricum rufum]|uniref:ATP-NAD kinase n=1 Tax=Halogeometricum rufum TaxID=553469 RepID=A0A1I6J1K3_9EURY|nr:NAD(+)/NADH kinase [Halogeometricum rufum]SFR72400.1 ATP-NAD kinase [Halogeometricum rufum]